MLVIDKAGYHRTKAVGVLLDEHADHVFVIWLPPYSPQLNPIEGLWGYLKRSALNNYFYGEIESLETAMHKAFTELQQHAETALSPAYKINTNLRETTWADGRPGVARPPGPGRRRSRLPDLSGPAPARHFRGPRRRPLSPPADFLPRRAAADGCPTSRSRDCTS